MRILLIDGGDIFPSHFMLSFKIPLSAETNDSLPQYCTDCLKTIPKPTSIIVHRESQSSLDGIMVTIVDTLIEQGNYFRIVLIGSFKAEFLVIVCYEIKRVDSYFVFLAQLLFV